MLTEHDPIMKTLEDQFRQTFEPDAELAGLKAITEQIKGMQEDLRGTDMQLLNKAIEHGRDLSLLLRSLNQRLPAQFDSAVEESRDMLHNIQNTLAGIRMHFYMDEKNPPTVCTCGKCDSCVEARSDEHYDRKSDGLLMRG